MPAGSIIRVHVLAETAGLTIARQTELFDSGGQGDQPRQYERLMDRLSNRLGPDAVVRPQLRRDAQPERAFDFEPAIRGGNIVSLQTGEQSRASGSAREDCGPCFTRPLTLLAEPQSILLTLKTDGGAPKRFTLRGRSHTIAWSRGPERIETGWWRDAAIGRDYFKVQTTTGRQFWIFRRLDRDQWFLHGCFD